MPHAAGSGGSHGGLGGSQGGASNTVYDDYANPTDSGSGSGPGGSVPTAGGGVLFLNAGTLQLDGALLASGASSFQNSFTGFGGGGGAGGDAQVAQVTVNQIAQVDSRYMIGGTNWVGLAVPLHCSASGKVLLAFGATAVPAGPVAMNSGLMPKGSRAQNSSLATVSHSANANMPRSRVSAPVPQ